MRVLLLIIGFFFLFGIIGATPVTAAVACCLSGHYEKQGGYEGCCQLAANCFPGNSAFYDKSKFACGPFTCDQTTQQCTNKTPDQVASEYDPLCHPGFYDPLNVVQCRGFCCRGGMLGNIVCDRKPGSPLILNSCADQQTWLYLEPKDSCPPSNSIIYELKGGKCSPKAPTGVSLCIAGATCQTAFGTFDTKTPAGIIEKLLAIALVFTGLSIVIVLLTLGYRVLTSQGNPEKIQSAKELATSLVGGVVLIIFSVVLLKAIGVDILGLPGFG